MTVIRENAGDAGPTSIQSTYRAYDARGQSLEHTATQKNAVGRSSKVTPRVEGESLGPSVHHVDTNRLSTIQNEAGEHGFSTQKLAIAGSKAPKTTSQVN
jgi:hypothetical protein